MWKIMICLFVNTVYRGLLNSVKIMYCLCDQGGVKFLYWYVSIGLRSVHQFDINLSNCHNYNQNQSSLLPYSPPHGIRVQQTLVYYWLRVAFDWKGIRHYKSDGKQISYCFLSHLGIIMYYRTIGQIINICFLQIVSKQPLYLHSK